MRRYPFSGEIGLEELEMTGFKMCARLRERDRLGAERRRGREKERAIAEEREFELLFLKSGRA